MEERSIFGVTPGTDIFIKERKMKTEDERDRKERREKMNSESEILEEEKVNDYWYGIIALNEYS